MPVSSSSPLPAVKKASSGYTIREASAAVGLTPSRIRRAVQRKWLTPRRGDGGEYRLSFQDMVLLKTVKDLLEANVPSRRTFAALDGLRDRQGPHRAKPLSALRVYADGAAVVVQDGQALWNVETGQGHLAFDSPRGDVRRLGRGAVSALPHSQPQTAPAMPSAPAAPPAPERIDDLDSDDWYNIALDLEEAEPDKAPGAYERSIALNPDNVDAHVNLGRLWQVRGDIKRAAGHYRLALQMVPRHQLANYNLGTVFDELGELDMALGYYRKATEIPDAHYNLSRIFELRGDELASLRHMRQYKTLASMSGGELPN